MNIGEGQEPISVPAPPENDPIQEPSPAPEKEPERVPA